MSDAPSRHSQSGSILGSSAFLVQLVGCRTESIENVLNCASKWRLLSRIRKRSCQTLTSYYSSESNASTNNFDYSLSWIRSRRVRCAGAYRSRGIVVIAARFKISPGKACLFNSIYQRIDTDAGMQSAPERSFVNGCRVWHGPMLGRQTGLPRSFE